MSKVYEELKEKVLPLLSYYKDDLIVYDKKDIESKPGLDFIHGARDTGTDIWFINNCPNIPDFLLRSTNTVFHLCYNSVIIPISRKNVEKIVKIVMEKDFNLHGL